MQNTLCAICADDCKIFAIGTCNHPICHSCSLRLRLLYKKNECSICKTTCPLIVLSSKPLLFEDFDLSNLLKDEGVMDGISFESKSIMEEAKSLLLFKCSECLLTLKNWSQLKFHLKKEHKRFICDVCQEHKKVFPTEIAYFTQQKLAVHKKTGDSDPSFKGHPECEFCSLYYYSYDELYEHCRDAHEHCFLCQRNGNRNQYFRNYDTLVEHFHVDHHPCNDPVCIEKKFVVFNSDIDLQAHLVTLELIIG